MTTVWRFVEIAEDLESAGLVWQPEIGDEVLARTRRDSISVLVDPQGMSPGELRSTYLWLPTLEQMIIHLEARQAILFHAGLELSERTMQYKTVIQAPKGQFESAAESLRNAVGMALRSILLSEHTQVH